MTWRSRSLCLPVLAAAGLGCLTGLAISGSGGPAEIGVIRAAGTQTLAYPLPTPSVSAKPGATTITSKPTSTSVTGTSTTPKKKTSAGKSKGKSKSKSKAYPLPKPKSTGAGGTSAKSVGSNSKSGSGFDLGEGPRGPAGPAGAAGPVGPAGPQGPTGPVSNVVRSLTLNWRNGVWLVDPNATTVLPGLGTATLTCTPAVQSLTITPATAGARTVVDTDTAQGAGTQGATSVATATSVGPPITVAVPNNGMIFATISVQPVGGDGGSGPNPASMTLSSQWKLNDPNPVNNFCFVAAQFVGKP